MPPGRRPMMHRIFRADPMTAMAVWAQEQGFVGASLVVLLYGLLVLWGLRIASVARDRFGTAVATGVSALFFWQARLALAIGGVAACENWTQLMLGLFAGPTSGSSQPKAGVSS